MAERLNLSCQELADFVLTSSTKEQRFAKMKIFYSQLYPEAKEFYATFSKNKRKADDDNDGEDKEEEKTQKKKRRSEARNKTVDYYENLSTMESFLGLIDDEKSQSSQSDEMATKEQIGQSEVNDLNELTNQQTSTVKEKEPSTYTNFETDREKRYNQIMDEILN
jgi:hypothetical protein